MTGTELSAALAEKLKVLLPDCAVRPAFTGTLQRLPQRAAVTVGVMQEENADGVFETVLGVQLENEYGGNISHIHTLRKLAANVECGVWGHPAIAKSARYKVSCLPVAHRLACDSI